jgi:hypothetical protein
MVEISLSGSGGGRGRGDCPRLPDIQTRGKTHRSRLIPSAFLNSYGNFAECAVMSNPRAPAQRPARRIAAAAELAAGHQAATAELAGVDQTDDQRAD